MIQVLVAAVEQERRKCCWKSDQGTLSLLNHFQKTWFCRHLPVPRGGCERFISACICVCAGNWGPLQRFYSEEQKHFLCWTICITAPHNKFILTTSIVWLFSWISVFYGSMICSVSKSVGSRQKSWGRVNAYLGFIFRKPGRTCSATGISTALESVQCWQVIICMVCDI